MVSEGAQKLGTAFYEQLYRGGELLAAGKVIEAKEHLEEAYRLGPQDEKAQNLLGLTYFKLGLFDRASEIYEALVVGNAGDPTLRVNLGLVYLKAGLVERAVEQFEAAIHLQPDHAKAHNYLGLALAQAGDYARAREHFVLAGSTAMVEKMEQALAEASEPSAVPFSREDAGGAAGPSEPMEQDAVFAPSLDMRAEGGEEPAYGGELGFPREGASFEEGPVDHSAGYSAEELEERYAESIEAPPPRERFFEAAPQENEPQFSYDGPQRGAEGGASEEERAGEEWATADDSQQPLLMLTAEDAVENPAEEENLHSASWAARVEAGRRNWAEQISPMAEGESGKGEQAGLFSGEWPAGEAPPHAVPPILPIAPAVEEPLAVQSLGHLESVLPQLQQRALANEGLVSESESAAPAARKGEWKVVEGLGESVPVPAGSSSGEVFSISEEWVALAVDGELILRGAHARSAVSGDLDFTAEFGDGDGQFLRARGQGSVVLDAEGHHWVAFELGGESVCFREESVFAFEAGVAFAEELLPGTEDARLLRLRGQGKVLLRLPGRVKSLEVTAARPVWVPFERLLGWYGNVAAEEGIGALGKGVRVSGEGIALFVLAMG